MALVVLSAFAVVPSPTENLEVEGQTFTWLTGWQYRKRLTFIGSSGAGYDYQMMIKVRRSFGVDNGSLVYVGDKCRTDFGDIRFTDTNGVLQPYTITRLASDEAVFWVRCVTIDLSLNSSIFMYYGNATATSQSNPDATFVFADPFDNATLNPRWSNDSFTTGTSCSIDTGQKYLRLYASGTNYHYRIRSTNTSLVFPSSWIMDDYYADQGVAPYRLYTSITISGVNSFSLHNAPWGTDYGVAYIRQSKTATTNPNIISYGVGHNDDLNETLGTTNPWNLDDVYLKHKVQDRIFLHRTNVHKYNETNTETINRVFFHVSTLASSGSISEGRLYAFKIRKYVTPEPACGAWSPEENFSTLTTTLSVNALPVGLVNVPFKLNETYLYTPHDANVTPGTYSLLALNEQLILNATHIYNFRYWTRNDNVYSYDRSCVFTVSLGDNVNFTMVYEAFAVNVSTTPMEVNALFEANGWEMSTPIVIYRGPGLHTFRCNTLQKSYNSTHRLAFIGWFYNDIYITPSDTVNIYIAYTSTLKLAYRFELLPEPPPTPTPPPPTQLPYLRAQSVFLGEVQQGSTNSFNVNVQFDLDVISVTKVEFQTYAHWFKVTTPLPVTASRGAEQIGVAQINAEVTVPSNIQGLVSVPFTVTVQTANQSATLTTSNYVTMTVIQPLRGGLGLAEQLTSLYEWLRRLFGDPLILAILLALTVLLSYYSLKRQRRRR